MAEAKDSPETLALRARPRPVTRLNRRTLALALGAIASAVLGGTLWSLQSHRNRSREPGSELHNVDRIAHAEGLDQLPSDYSRLPPRPTESPPVLGNPLPGDLGVPMLHAEQRVSQQPEPTAAPAIVRPDPAADAARIERANREREAEEAAKAPLFFRRANRKEVAAPAAASAAGEHANADVRPNATATAASSNGNQDDKNAFLAHGAGEATRSSHALQTPSSPYQVMAGTFISAALITGINSDLPGKVLASVTEPVYDSATGRFLLIPQGSRLLGEYDSQVAAGQRRVLLVWTRIIFPDTSSISLDRLPGVDAAGYAGLEDGVDRHWSQLLAGAALSTMIGIGAELAAPDRGAGQGQVIVATRQSVEDSVNQVGQALTRRDANLQPTLTIRTGFPVRVIVARDVVLKPYEPLTFDRSPP
jgi:type IV secretion system protein TrbI